MTKSSKEIIRGAKHLAQVDNSKAFDWDVLVSLLNNAYTKVYNDLSLYSNSFVSYFSFTGTEADLPADCNKVLSVFRGSKDNPYNLSQSAYNSFIPGGYVLENRTIRIVGKQNDGKVTVKYSKLPVTLTFPDDDEELGIASIAEAGLADDDGFYYKTARDTTTYYYYDFSEQESTEHSGSMPQQGDLFMGYRITRDDDGRLIWNGTDVTDYFLRDENDDISHISNTVTDGTHMAILYDDGDLYAMLSDFSKYQINPDLYKGRLYSVDYLYAICADDSTGRYIIIGKDGGIRRISFVPDTVVDYPDNVFFDIIEDKVAIQLQSMQGLNNDALQTKLSDDEVSFYGSLMRTNNGLRVRNVLNAGRRMY